MRRTSFVSSSTVLCNCGRLLNFDAAELRLFCPHGCQLEVP